MAAARIIRGVYLDMANSGDLLETTYDECGAIISSRRVPASSVDVQQMINDAIEEEHREWSDKR